jgi:hypothetical protein
MGVSSSWIGNSYIFKGSDLLGMAWHILATNNFRRSDRCHALFTSQSQLHPASACAGEQTNGMAPHDVEAVARAMERSTRIRL